LESETFCDKNLALGLITFSKAITSEIFVCFVQIFSCPKAFIKLKIVITKKNNFDISEVLVLN
jgi:hypothetical protein